MQFLIMHFSSLFSHSSLFDLNVLISALFLKPPICVLPSTWGTKVHTKVKKIQNCNITFGLHGREIWSVAFMMVQTEGVWEQGAEGNVWT
jgi:hypothetical protein